MLKTAVSDGRYLLYVGGCTAHDFCPFKFLLETKFLTLKNKVLAVSHGVKCNLQNKNKDTIYFIKTNQLMAISRPKFIIPYKGSSENTSQGNI